jgi:hypothetical protein
VAFCEAHPKDASCVPSHTAMTGSNAGAYAGASFGLLLLGSLAMRLSRRERG